MLTVEQYMAQSTSVKIFGLEGCVLDALDTSLSPERLAIYVNAAGGDREQAVRLYTWNTAVSAAFYGPLQGLEVALRNAMHGQLNGVYGPAWFDNPACGLDVGALDRIDQAERTLVKNGYPANPPHLVAELSFGFWVSLLGKGGFGRASNPLDQASGRRLRHAEVVGERVGSAGGFFAQRGLRIAMLLGMIDRVGAAGRPDHPWGRHTGPEPVP